MKWDDGENGEASRDKPPLGARREVLLYVEDDDDNWAVAELRLASSYELIRASTAEQACQILRTRRSSSVSRTPSIAMPRPRLGDFSLATVTRETIGKSTAVTR